MEYYGYSAVCAQRPGSEELHVRYRYPVDLLYHAAFRIDEAGIIKVADFGLAKSTYEKLYFRQDMGESVKLPIKWLAIECIEDGVFSEKSDVVRFKYLIVL